MFWWPRLCRSSHQIKLFFFGQVFWRRWHHEVYCRHGSQQQHSNLKRKWNGMMAGQTTNSVTRATCSSGSAASMFIQNQSIHICAPACACCCSKGTAWGSRMSACKMLAFFHVIPCDVRSTKPQGTWFHAYPSPVCLILFNQVTAARWEFNGCEKWRLWRPNGTSFGRHWGPLGDSRLWSYCHLFSFYVGMVSI